MPSQILNTTVAQAIAWLVSFGIAAGVSYVLGWFPDVPAWLKKIIATVTIAALVAIVTALASFIPPGFLDLKLLDAIVAVIVLVLSSAGWMFGTFKVTMHRAELREARVQLGER